MLVNAPSLGLQFGMMKISGHMTYLSCHFPLDISKFAMVPHGYYLEPCFRSIIKRRKQKQSRLFCFTIIACLSVYEALFYYSVRLLWYFVWVSIFYKHLQKKPYVQIRKFYLRKILSFFLPIIFNMCFGCSKEPSH